MNKIKEFILGHIHIIAVLAAAILVLAAVIVIDAVKEEPEQRVVVNESRAAKKPKKEKRTENPDAKAEGSAKPEASDAPSGTSAPGTSAPKAAASAAAATKAPERQQNSAAGTAAADDAAMEYSIENGMEIDPQTGMDQYNTEPVPEGMPLPEEPQTIELGDERYTCTLSVSCATILSNITRLDREKTELVPEDGWIFAPQQVSFTDGESVFDVLKRTMRENGIHMEFSNSPMYNSAYIEGINNLYEYDCGERSGWQYKVNGWFPNYGCSRYVLHDGDVVEWVYTCDNGRDVGGYIEN